MGEEEGDGETHAAEQADADHVAPGGPLGEVGQAESHGQQHGDGDAQGLCPQVRAATIDAITETPPGECQTAPVRTTPALAKTNRGSTT